MTGKEWSKLCKEHGVVVLDANYKDMTQDDALKYFDLLKTAMDHAFARKYDLETGQYEDYALPEGSTYYEDDMNKLPVVNAKRKSCTELLIHQESS